MLVLSRKANQSIIVDGPCKITVLNSSCKLGIDGNAKVLREELISNPLPMPETKPVVYLVDDDPDLLEAYCCYFKHFDFDVRPFSHGGKFLDCIQSEANASVAVLDLRLAEEDITGLQILQRLREWKHNYPVILLTGYGDVDTCRRAFHGGCYEFLQKPLAPEDLAKTIKEAASRYRQGEIGKRNLLNSLAG